MAKNRLKLADARRPAGMTLLVGAALLLVLAYHSVSTNQYLLYSRNYAYYLEKAEECRSKVGQELSVHYENLAEQWESTAQEAEHYLNEHRAGAASLGLASAVAVGMGFKLMMPPKKKKQEKKQDG